MVYEYIHEEWVDSKHRSNEIAKERVIRDVSRWWRNLEPTNRFRKQGKVETLCVVVHTLNIVVSNINLLSNFQMELLL